MARRRTPEQAKAAFLAILAEREARLADGAVYVETQTAVAITCRRKHTWPKRPAAVLGGAGICRTCAGKDPAAAKAAFLRKLATLGAELAAGAVYVDTQTPVDVICIRKHLCHPTPNRVQQGQGLCSICARRDRATAEAEFLALVDRHGARLADGAAYIDAHTPVAVICAGEHERPIRPHDLKKKRRKTLCTICSGRDKAAIEAKLWALVKQHGARRVRGARYVNRTTPVALICDQGHRCDPLPGNVLAGHGICDRCRATYDRVYLLVHPAAGAVKVGVTGSDARVRGHVGRGYRLVAQWAGLNHDTALAAERAVIARWRAAGIEPVAVAPRNGRTETASFAHLAATRAHLELLLGAPTEDGAVDHTADGGLPLAA